MAYIKPQYPLKNGDNYLYPVTTHDQILLDDGSRWDGDVGVTSINGETGATNLTYADVGAAAASHTHDGVYTTSNLTFSLSGTTLTITTK